VVVVEVNGYEIEPGANLTEANLLMADLTGVDLRGANLTGANLEGAWFNDDTRWPDGFDPVAAGVIYK
jgi:uncharacterized protein YjbI with pentapeptide repeats